MGLGSEASVFSICSWPIDLSTQKLACLWVFDTPGSETILSDSRVVVTLRHRVHINISHTSVPPAAWPGSNEPTTCLANTIHACMPTQKTDRTDRSECLASDKAKGPPPRCLCYAWGLLNPQSGPTDVIAVEPLHIMRFNAPPQLPPCPYSRDGDTIRSALQPQDKAALKAFN